MSQAVFDGILINLLDNRTYLGLQTGSRLSLRQTVFEVMLIILFCSYTHICHQTDCISL